MTDINQENQSVVSIPPESRNKDGTFKKGFAANPNGARGLNRTGLQSYGKRAAYWINKLSLEELIELVNSRERVGKLNVQDAMIVHHLAKTMQGCETRQERESLLNRTEGRPTQTIIQTINAPISQSKTYVDAREAEAAYRDEMRRAVMDAPIDEEIMGEPAQEEGEPVNAEPFEPTDEDRASAADLAS